jgi:hypothetical protein
MFFSACRIVWLASIWKNAVVLYCSIYMLLRNLK